MELQHLHHLFTESKGICTDTRKIEKDTLFFALKGANFNGNAFASEALEQGVNYVIVDEPKVVKDDRYILVDDVLDTLQKLANYHRKQFQIPVIGITGSNGKTTSKELIGEVLKQKYSVLMTQGNLNNHLGVPFTLLNLNASHDIAIIEMGANKPGDIKELAEIAEPDHGIITNIGMAHIEGFGGYEGVIKTKTELYHFIAETSGKLFMNAEDEILGENIPEGTTVITYGELSGNIKGKLEGLTPFVNLRWFTDEYRSPVISTQLVGKYNFTNFLAAVCIGNHFEVSEEQINKALARYTPSNNRSQVTKTERNTLIVDCYNANPSSMQSALESFFEIQAVQKTVILGDMLELGHISEQSHLDIAKLVRAMPVNAFLIGEEFKKINVDLPTYGSVNELIDQEKLSDIKQHLILLKGSRGIKLEALIPLL